MANRIILTIAVSAITAASVARAATEISPIRISVNVTGHTDTEREKPPKKGGIIAKSTVTQDKFLEITLTNGARTNFSGLTVKYFIFARELSNDKILPPVLGKQDVDVPSTGSVKVKSESLVTTYTRQHSKKTQGDVVVVPEEGQRYAGYGVQLFRGDTLLTETFDPPSLKAKIGTAVIEPVDGKKKSK